MGILPPCGDGERWEHMGGGVLEENTLQGHEPANVCKSWVGMLIGRKEGGERGGG